MNVKFSASEVDAREWQSLPKYPESRPLIILATNEGGSFNPLLNMLRLEGYDCEVASLDLSLAERCRAMRPRVVLLDLASAPYIGLSLLGTLKGCREMEGTEIFAFTGERNEAAEICALEMGADQCTAHPLRTNVVLARIRAALRRPDRARSASRINYTEAQKSNKSRGSFLRLFSERCVLNLETRSLSIDGRYIDLTFTEYEILKCLSSRPGWVFSRGQIIDQTRGTEYAVTERAIDVHLVSLRKKLGTHGTCIQTVRGVGYRMCSTDPREVSGTEQGATSVDSLRGDFSECAELTSIK